MAGDGTVLSKRDAGRTQAMLRWFERIGKGLGPNMFRRRNISGAGGGGIIRRAITTQAAPADTKITANLYDGAGSEITSGEGSGIDVYCNISGGGNLDTADRHLNDNDDIIVVNIQGKWWAIEGFQHWDPCE